MNKQVFKVIGFGILVGAIAYFAPGVLLFFLLFFGLMKIFGRKRYRHYREYQVVYADKIRSMSEEEYATHKENLGRNNHCC